MLTIAGYTSEWIGGAKVVSRDAASRFVRDAIAEAGSLYDYAASHPAAQVIRGRQLVYVIPTPDSGRWVVRHLSHGGLPAPLTGDRFLNLGTPRPFNELQVSLRLIDMGIRTPPVVVAAVYPSGVIYRGEVAREEVTDASDLAECLFGSKLPNSLRPDALSAAGRLIGSLHRGGVAHPDLNIRNVLIRWSEKTPEAYILDVEKCRIRPRLSKLARRRMLSRLQRSARKLEERSRQLVSKGEWDAFLAAYVKAFRGEAGSG